MLEKDIETAVKDYARSKGCLAYKFVSPGHAFVPDCLIISPKGVVFFLEFKRPGGKATSGQEREMARINAHLVPAFLVDSVAAGKQCVDMMVDA